jgi:hypothetical protein
MLNPPMSANPLSTTAAIVYGAIKVFQTALDDGECGLGLVAKR